jgi:hypothetical protein
VKKLHVQSQEGRELMVCTGPHIWHGEEEECRDQFVCGQFAKAIVTKLNFHNLCNRIQRLTKVFYERPSALPKRPAASTGWV